MWFSIDWLLPELNHWRYEGGLQNYVLSLEDALVQALSNGESDEEENLHEKKEAKPETKEVTKDGIKDVTKGKEATTPRPKDALLPPSSSSHSTTHSTVPSIPSRISRLPFHCDASVEYCTGRNIQLSTDCYVLTTTYQHKTNKANDKKPEQNSVEHQLIEPQPIPQPRTYIVATLLDLDGNPRPYKMEAGVTVRAKLHVGGPVDAIHHSISSSLHELSVSSTTSHRLSRSFSQLPGFGRQSPSPASSMHNVGNEHSEFDLDMRNFVSGAIEQICKGKDREKANEEQPYTGKRIVEDVG